MRFSSLPKTLLVVHHHLINYPTPPNISYAWSFGGLTLVVMLIQIATGVFLTMHYVPELSSAFSSVEQHIMRDVNYGWIMRYLHANGASFIFLLLYWHMGRSMYFKTYNPPRQMLWVSGVIIFLLLMATGFLGYVLPWGQMSFWGATVITNLFSAIPIVGPYIASWLWGGFSVGKATLVKFFTLHYLLPFVAIGIVMVHLSFLHEAGSTESAQEEVMDEWEFGVYFAIKDALVFITYLIVASFFIWYGPNLLGHSDNAIFGNPLVTPRHIVPEWYFLPFYAILKCVPNKRLGVLMMIWSIIYFLFYGDADPRWNVLLTKYTPSYYWYRSIFWLFVANLLILAAIGALPAQAPYTDVGRFATWLYFVLMVLYSQSTPWHYFFKFVKYVNAIRHELALLEAGSVPSKTTIVLNLVESVDYNDDLLAQESSDDLEDSYTSNAIDTFYTVYDSEECLYCEYIRCAEGFDEVQQPGASCFFVCQNEFDELYAFDPFFSNFCQGTQVKTFYYLLLEKAENYSSNPNLLQINKTTIFSCFANTDFFANFQLTDAAESSLEAIIIFCEPGAFFITETTFKIFFFLEYVNHDWLQQKNDFLNNIVDAFLLEAPNISLINDPEPNKNDVTQ